MKHGTPIVRLSSTALLLIVWLAAVSVAPLAAETPPGLLTLTGESSTPPPERDWEKLGIREWELRELERFHRGDGYEGFHVAYKSLKLHMTGILTRPYIVDEETRYPLIVLNHGSERGVSERYRAVALELARRGYVVVAPTFRGRGGLEGRSQGLVEYGKGEVIDLLQLAQLARKLKYVDPTRSGIIGEGHGATATLLAMERSNVFHAAVVVSPAVFSGMVENGVRRYGSVADDVGSPVRARAAAERSDPRVAGAGRVSQCPADHNATAVHHHRRGPQLSRPAPVSQQAQRTRHRLSADRVPRPRAGLSDSDRHGR